MVTKVKRFERPVTLAVGQTVTPELNIPGEEIVGFAFDANLTGTTITFTAAIAKGGTFLGVNDNTAAISLTVAASKYRGLSQDERSKLRCLENFKITAGATQLTNPSVITVITKQVV